MRTILSSCLPLCLVLYAEAAQAKRDLPPPAAAVRSRYLGPHPIAAQRGGGYCYLDVPHLHDYAPDRPFLYQHLGDAHLFVGDPVPFGYEGPRTVFYGAHPVQVHLDVAPPAPIYCSLRGPHFHPYAAPAALDYQVKDGVVFYVGPLPQAYLRLRPQLERAFDDEYRPFVALRPRVTVTPPPEWHGEVWVAPPARTVVVPPPAPVVVTAPAPRVQVAAPRPSVVVTAPAPPSVIITPPAPPAVIVVPPGPPGVILAPGPRVHVHGHPGKHKGWYKVKKHKHGGWDD